MGYPKSIFTELVDAVKEEGLELEKALKVVTSNVADILKLNRKGRIEEGKDADVVLINDNFDITHVVAMGDFFVKDSEMIRKGSYEK